MVSVNPNPAPQGFYLFDPTNMGLPGLNSMPPPTTPSTTTTTTSSAPQNAASLAEDLSKKIRKPYTITKSRESWTEQEHDKFLEALQLFDRDWKKIEAFIGSKTVIQIRSHAQKYFLKVQKKGTSEHVPPPRPKRKATHPYPQKAPKSAPVASQVVVPFESSSALLEHGYAYQPDSSFVLGTPVTSASLPSWSHSYVPPVNASQITKDDGKLAGSTDAQNSCYSSSNESKPTTRQPQRVLPDFAQVYKFIGSVFDPSSTSHLERLKQMDPINLETALLLMRNLSINLTSPEFEDHRRILLSYETKSEKAKPENSCNFSCHGKSENAILST
ncbi:protein REVEILLE 5 isoform X1 [Rosa rugosa]|uniref:protein REVEILLE 5 isoform X1 n=1 Tax=Rosa rugosa TaxID=74645 RepID=UPI002B40D843|nr:protein REVEILLE 5 isoform X1 [Rosa rugosa]